MRNLVLFQVPRNFLYGAGLFVIALTFYGGLYALWLTGLRDSYFAFTDFWGIHAWLRPFLDLEGVLSWGECHHLGFEVLKVNPCDPLHRPLAYGPPLINLWFHASDAAVAGPAQGLAFIAAVPFVIRPRSFEELVVAVVAALSPATLYAMERGNLDLIEFMLVALTGPLIAIGNPGRLASYLLFYVGGTAKFYPFALLLTVLRERPRTALLLIALSTLALGAYAVHYWSQFLTIKLNLPGFQYNGDTFGSYGLPFGLADLLNLPPIFGVFATLFLIAGFGVYALLLAIRFGTNLAVISWEQTRLHYLLAGCIVITGCFFTQTNIDYRAIFLMLMLAGLFELRNSSSTRPLRRTFTIAIWVLAFCLWSDFFRNGIDKILDLIAPDRPDPSLWDQVSNAFFVGRELAWWWLVSLSASVVVVFLSTSPVGNAVMARLAGTRRR